MAGRVFIGKSAAFIEFILSGYNAAVPLRPD